MSEEKSNSGLLSLGDVESEAIVDAAATDESRAKLSNDNGSNVWAIVSPDYKPIQEHWFDIEGKRKCYPCGVHKFNDNEKIIRGFVPDDCPFCKIVLSLYRDAKENPKSALAEKKKEIAGQLRANLGFIFLAIQGDADMKRVGGKRVIIPFFQDRRVQKLYLSGAAFEMLRSEFREQGHNSTTAVGLPVNFERGKKPGKGGKTAKFSQVLSIEFFPQQRIKDVPKKLPDLTQFGSYDEMEAQELAQKWLSAYESAVKTVGKKKK